jgi:hypothetical protein
MGFEDGDADFVVVVPRPQLVQGVVDSSQRALQVLDHAGELDDSH